jgi:hypothetical protein
MSCRGSKVSSLRPASSGNQKYMCSSLSLKVSRRPAPPSPSPSSSPSLAPAPAPAPSASPSARIWRLVGWRASPWRAGWRGSRGGWSAAKHGGQGAGGAPGARAAASSASAAGAGRPSNVTRRADAGLSAAGSNFAAGRMRNWLGSGRPSCVPSGSSSTSPAPCRNPALGAAP